MDRCGKHSWARFEFQMIGKGKSLFEIFLGFIIFTGTTLPLFRLSFTSDVSYVQTVTKVFLVQFNSKDV